MKSLAAVDEPMVSQLVVGFLASPYERDWDS